MTVLRGITWDHVRGLAGLRATARAYAAEAPDVHIEWTTRSLQAFADQNVDELAGRFNLLVIDHPAIGFAVECGALLPLDEHVGPEVVAEQRRSSVGRSFESYRWRDRTWALAVDAAAQVAAYRPDLMQRAGVALPTSWVGVVQVADALAAAGSGIAMAAIPVDVVCAFLAICAADDGLPFEGRDHVAPREIGAASLEVLREVLDRCDPRSLGLNPPRLFEVMTERDEIAYCPLAFGYSNYARPGYRRTALRFAPAPAGTLGGAGLAVSARGRDLEAAIRYATFVARSDVQRSIYFREGGQPGHREAWRDDEVNAASGGFFRDTLDALDAAYLRPRYDGFLGFQEAGGKRLHRWLQEGGNTSRVLDDLDSAYRASLAGAETTRRAK